MIGLIQARMSSKRFPGKMLRKIKNKPLIDYVWERCNLSTVDEWAVVTSDESSDDVLCEYLADKKIEYFRGNLDDVASRFISAVEDIQRQSYGTIAYASSITILIILFWNSNPSAVCAGVLVMAFGDGLAGLLGRQIKSSNWQILGQTKSIAGTLTMLGMGTLMLFLITLNNFVNINLVQIISISLLATGLEQISVMGIDNLSVPLVTAFAWNWITKI